MKLFKYDYTICRNNSSQAFKNACRELNDVLSGWEKDDLLIDVDGSCVQAFGNGDERVIVYDDYEVGAVFVKSDIDLSGMITIV